MEKKIWSHHRGTLAILFKPEIMLYMKLTAMSKIRFDSNSIHKWGSRPAPPACLVTSDGSDNIYSPQHTHPVSPVPPDGVGRLMSGLSWKENVGYYLSTSTKRITHENKHKKAVITRVVRIIFHGINTLKPQWRFHQQDNTCKAWQELLSCINSTPSL